MKIFIISLSSGKFRYALVNRPAGIGTCPKGFIAVEDRPARGSDHYDMARHGIVVYDRRLTDAETKNFELAFCADGADRKSVAHEVAKQLAEYASAYLEMYDEEREDFEGTVSQHLKDVKSYPPSVGNMEQFSTLVKTELQHMV